MRELLKKYAYGIWTKKRGKLINKKLIKKKKNLAKRRDCERLTIDSRGTLNTEEKYTELLNVGKRLFRDKRRKRRKSNKIFFTIHQ